MKRFVLLVLLCAACSEKEPGKRLAAGVGRGLLLAKGGGAVAFLVDARHPDDRTVPDDLYLGDLYLASTAPEREARKAGASVSTVNNSYRFSPGGTSLALLAGWRFRAGAGELWVAKVTEGDPRKLADEAQSFGWAPQGEKLAYVAGGRLFALDGAAGEPRALAEGVHSFAWSPDGARLAARAPASAGGQLWLIDATGGSKRAVSAGVTDFAFAPNGALAVLGPAGPKGGDRPLAVLEPGSETPRALGQATSFAFAPSGRALLALSTASAPGEAVGDLSRIPLPEGQPQPLGSRASDFRFTPAGDVLFLARYDVRSRSGTLSMAKADGGAVRVLAPRVQSFTLAANARYVLYLVQKPLKGDFKIELWLADLTKPAAAPRKIDEGVYGYEPAPDGKLLYWKARCGLGPRSCSLFRGPLDGAAPPVEVIKNVAGFDLSQDGSRLLISAPHRGSSRAVDLSWLPSSAGPEDKARPVAADVDPSAQLLDAQGRRAVFAVLDPRKPGVYLAELP